MNEYVKNLDRIEFVVTYACTGRCKHCAEGDHAGSGVHLDAETAANVLRGVSGVYAIDSVMTFGGEPLLYPETVLAVHKTALELGIPRRQLITNGYFSKDEKKIAQIAREIVECGVNDVLLSVDAFHQETIPIEPVFKFATELASRGANLRVHPAWVVNKDHINPYNIRTREILSLFEAAGISESSGNDIIPSGNARKYLSEYYDMTAEYVSPYREDPTDLRAISIDPDGSVLGGNVYETDVLSILDAYRP